MRTVSRAFGAMYLTTCRNLRDVARETLISPFLLACILGAPPSIVAVLTPICFYASIQNLTITRSITARNVERRIHSSHFLWLVGTEFIHLQRGAVP
jgi:hypothetical protein